MSAEEIAAILRFMERPTPDRDLYRQNAARSSRAQ
jgi:hypothetical protein